MKPNDKAIEAAILAIKEKGPYYAGSKIRESMAKHLAEVALPAAYAAQFQSEDYDALLKSLHANAAISQTESENQLDEHGVNSTLYIAAADALEAVLAERDALRKWKEDDSDAMRIFTRYRELEAERNAAIAEIDTISSAIKSHRYMDPPDGGSVTIAEQVARMWEENEALLARLAPVDDEALVEICAKGIASSKTNGYEAWMQESRAAIAAIRPHIEAAERERCAKAGKAALLKSNYGELHADANYADELGEEIAAAIRSGK